MGRETKPDTKTKNWIEGAFNKQGMISIESGLDKTGFRHGILFRRARYCPLRGIIRFQYRGARLHTGNILEEQSTMLSRITRFTGEEPIPASKRRYALYYKKCTDLLYAGCIGVDMLVYRQKGWIFRYSSLH